MITLKPKGSGFACMHVKCWFIDGSVMLSGSTNATHGGLENNKEHLYKICEPSVVNKALADFEQTWETATPVTRDVLDTMLANDATRKLHRHKGERDVSRSLSQELEESHSSQA